MPLLNEDELRSIREREQAATPGPWAIPQKQGGCRDIKAGKKGTHAQGHWRLGIASTWGLSDDRQDKANAEFIAHAREDVPKLLGHVQALQDEIIRLRAALKEPIPNELLALWDKYMTKTPQQLHYAAMLIRMSVPESATWESEGKDRDMLEILYTVSKALEWQELLARERLRNETREAEEGGMSGA